MHTRFLLLLGLICVTHLFPLVAQQPQPAQNNSKPTLRVGVRLFDEDGDVIDNAELTLSIHSIDRDASKTHRHSSGKITTDNNGRFTVKLPAKKNDKDLCLLKMTSAGLLIPKVYVDTDHIGDERDVRCFETQTRTSRLLDHRGQAVTGAEVKFYFQADSCFFKEVATTGPHGEFQLSVPINQDYGLVVDSTAGAHRRMVVPTGAKRIPEIRLTQGTTVSGILESTTGEPIANCVVMLIADDTQAVEAELSINGSRSQLELIKKVMTDATGAFSFGPIEGPFVIQLGLPDRHFSRQEFADAMSPPPFTPLFVRFDNPGEFRLRLKAAEPVPIRGTAVDENGKPVKGLPIELLQPPFNGLYYHTLAMTKTNQQGVYELMVPATMSEVEVTARYLDVDGKMLAPWSTKPYGELEHWQAGRFQLTDFDGAPTTVDWVCVSDDAPPDFVVNAREAANLSKPSVHPGIRLLESQVVQARRDDTDPRQTLMDLCFKIESQNRATRAGLSMIHYIFRAAESSLHDKPTKARQQAVDLLIDHYLEHEDLDLMLDGFDGGIQPKNAETFLQAAISNSPHRHVRASALYELARLKLSRVSWLPLLQRRREMLETLLPDQESPEQLESMKAEIERFKKLETEASLHNFAKRESEALELLQQVVDKYSDVRCKTRHWEGPASVRIADVSDHRLLWDTTIVERAKTMIFQSQLVVNQKAPLLSGIDLFQNRIQLDDFRGQVVLLTVTEEINDVQLYEACDQMLTKYADRPFSVVSILPTDAGGNRSVRDVVRQCRISWPIVRDTHNGHFAKKWCKFDSPELYVIDQQGVIRAHWLGELDSMSLFDQLIAKLLDEQVDRPR